MSVTDAATWGQLPTGGPPRRYNQAWAPLPGGQALMFGGDGYEFSAPNDRRAWLFDGKHWAGTAAATAAIPDAVDYHVMGWDGSRVLLWGGRDSGARGTLLTSDDAGVTWDRKEHPIVPFGVVGGAEYEVGSVGFGSAVCWSADLALYCACRVDGAVLTSTDGTNWTKSAQLPGDSYGGAIVWVGSLGRFVLGCLGGSVGFFTSPDAATWTARGGDGGVRDIVWSAAQSKFVAVGGGFGVTNQVQTSPDGITWTGRGRLWGTNNVGTGVAYSPSLSRWVATGSFSSTYTSPDGITWTFRNNVLAPGVPTANGVDWSPTLGLFALVGASNNTDPRVDAIATSPDGITWTKRGNPFGAGSNSGTGQQVVWVPEQAQFVASAYGSVTHNMATSPDGITWTGRSNPPLDGLYSAGPIAWSPSLSRLVVVGVGGPIALRDTWAYDIPTATWSKLAPATTPDATGWARMVETSHGLFLITPLQSNTPITATAWLWSGTNWVAKASLTGLSSFAITPMWDGTDVQLFGVYYSSGYHGYHASYDFGTNAWTASTPAGLPGGTDLDEGAAEPAGVWAGDRGIVVFSDDPYLYDADPLPYFTMHTWRYRASDGYTDMLPRSSPPGFLGSFRESVQEKLLMYDGARVVAYDGERGTTWVYTDAAPVFSTRVRRRR